MWASTSSPNPESLFSRARAGQIVSSKAALKALKTRVVNGQAFSLGVDGGEFVWRAGDFTVNAAADPGEGIYVAADDVAVSVGMWVRNHRGALYLEFWGADPTGVDSSITALENLITYVNAFGSRSVGMGVGFEIDLGGKTYNLKAGTSSRFMVDNIVIKGAGATVLADIGVVFGVADNVTQINGFYARDISFSYPPVITDVNATPFDVKRAVWGEITGITLGNAPRLAVFEGASAVARCNGFVIRNIRGVTANVAAPVVKMKNVAVMAIDDVRLLPDVPLVGDDDFSTSSAAIGNEFLRLEGAADTVEVGDKVLINRYREGIVSVTSSGEVQSNITVSRYWGDYLADSAIRLDVGGTLNHWDIERVYCRATDGDGISINVGATGYCFNVNIVRPTVLLCGRHGIDITTVTPSRAEGIEITQPKCEANNRLSLGGNDINIDGARFEIRGGRDGRKSDGLYLSGYSVQCERGLRVVNSDTYLVEGLRAGGSVASYDVPAHVTGSRLRSVKNNKVLAGHSVAARPEYSGLVSSSIPGSGVAWVNTTPNELVVNTRSTTGTVDAATIVIDGVTVHNKTDWQGVLMPGESITITRAVAMAWVVMARS